MNKYQQAQDPKITPDELRILATDKDSYVRCYVAQNPNTPEDALRTLATDVVFYVRYDAAHHPNATEIVRRLFLMTEAQFKPVTEVAH